MKLLVLFILSISTQFIEYSTAKVSEADEAIIQISKSTECDDEIKRLCSDLKSNSDISILSCLQDNSGVMEQISDKCQHFLWNYKHKLTTSNLFDSIVHEQCKHELVNIAECGEASKGYKISCLLDHKDQISEGICLKFLDHVAVIIFSDYHLIYKFMDQCRADISTFKCGRISKVGSKDKSAKYDDADKKSLDEMGVTLADYVTSQAHTIDCLIDYIQDISKDCQHQILRIAELQSNDYHLNRGLYLSCREDRETLCPKVKAGEGRVYKCLMNFKFSKNMSNLCRKELTRKQQVESFNVKANYPLYKRCKPDIDKNKCFKIQADPRDKMMFMSAVLICLHNAELNGNALEPSCGAEVDDMKRTILEDLQISPEAILACKNEAEEYCKDHNNEPYGVSHCLMRLAQPDAKHKKGQLSIACRDAMLLLLKTVNPTDDLMHIDASISEACTSSYLTLCPGIQSAKGAFSCMIQNINSPKMSPRCRENLSPILFFISLDITIDGALNLACHNDAVRLCNGPDTNEATMKRSQTEAQLEYHCMYQYFKKDKIQLDLAEARGVPVSNISLSLSAQCSNEIFNLIKVQASKIEIDPIVFMPCFDDIGRFCGGPHDKGKEHECLQTNIKSLEDMCRAAVIEFSQLEDLDYRLDSMIMDACTPMMNQFCPNMKPEQIILCLEKHKFHHQMTRPCYVAIEHLQIMSLEEFHIDHRFASFCGPEIEKYCQNELTKDGKANKEVGKATIVSCLSRMVTKQLLNGDKHPLSDECRRQFTFQLLQRSESIKLDPALLEDCENDIIKFCKDAQPNDLNLCLRENQDKLTNKCHKRLFRRERLEALDADFDGELQYKCSQMINERCHNVNGQKMFQCLHRLMNEHGFDSGCKKLIIARLERRMNDIRLNPGLINDCREDIKKYCHVDDPNTDVPISGIEYEGKIIRCLKIQYANSSNSLQLACRQRVLQIIIESNTNLRLDPTLRKLCASDIQLLCKNELSNKISDPVDGVHNCLKHKLLRDQIQSLECQQEVVRLLREGRADIHVDLELFEACENTIMKLCRSETFGESRKINCLLSLIEDKRASIMVEPHCLELIKDRKEMWDKVGTVESQSLHDLFQQVNQSSTRFYLVSMLGLIVAALLLLGIFCGRATKKLSVDLKNK